MMANSDLSPARLNSAGPGRLAKILPILQWLPQYQLGWLSADTFAGITLAAYAIPVSLAYATLAGLPPHYGIYCYLAGGLAYAVFGSSRQVAMGPTSAIALLVGVSVAELAQGDAARWAGIAALTALVMSVLGALAWLMRLSGLVNFISETILVGFKAGAALTIGLTQLPKLFGVEGGGDNFFESAWVLARQLSQTNLVVLMMGVAAMVLLLLGGKLFPGRPVALVAVVLSILAVSTLHLAERGVAIVGEIPAGLPDLTWPALRLRDINGVLPLAAACFLLAYVEGISAARALAERHGYEVDARQELLALGAANLATSFSQGFPVAGGLSQSAVNDKAGARTPLALVIASVAIGATLIFLTGFLYNLPLVMLASIVLVAVGGLIDLPALRHLWRVSRTEFTISMIALIGVLLLGILRGVLLAVIVSLLMLLAAASHPHVAVLGRIPGTKRFSDIQRHPDNETIPGVIIFRVEAALLYFNSQHVHNVVWNLASKTESLRLVICDLSNSPYVDVAGVAMLAKLSQEFAAQAIHLRIVEAHAQARDLLRAEGLEGQVGHVGRQSSIEQALVEFHPSPPV